MAAPDSVNCHALCVPHKEAPFYSAGEPGVRWPPKYREMEFKIAKFGTPEYEQSVELRDRILRVPFGLDRNALELDGEESQHHILALVDGKVVGLHRHKTINLPQR